MKQVAAVALILLLLFFLLPLVLFGPSSPEAKSDRSHVVL